MTDSSSGRRRKKIRGGPRPGSYLFLFAAFALAVTLIHAFFLNLPYFWDEMGQFVPAARDIAYQGAWVPRSTVPNAHPPGVMAYLAGVWKIFGYSIPSTRIAMLLLAATGLLAAFLLAIHLCQGLRGAPAFTVLLLLLVDPLFYMQSMMAQLDMPAMVFTVLALLLFFQDRHRAAALACTALVLAKETGVILPVIFIGALLIDRRRTAQAAYYVAPFIVLALWFALLWHTTGYLFGDPGFTHYNLGYALHPVRAAMCLLRRVYYLFVSDFRWIGSLALLGALTRTRMFATRAWRITGLFFCAHVLLVSLLGGAELERYLMPVLPLLYIAMAAAWSSIRRPWRYIGTGAMAAGLAAGLFWNPPYPFPLENNLAMVDFVRLHRDAAQYLEKAYPNQTIYTAWPLTQALRDPVFGYVDQKLSVSETSDLRKSTLEKIDPAGVNVVVLYSRTWEPRWGLLQFPEVEHFLRHFYDYEPQMNVEQVRQHFGLGQVRRWTERGQWIEVYARF